MPVIRPKSQMETTPTIEEFSSVLAWFYPWCERKAGRVPEITDSRLTGSCMGSLPGFASRGLARYKGDRPLLLFTSTLLSAGLAEW